MHTPSSQPNGETLSSLLEHYMQLSMHHRMITIGFGSIYFGLIQIIIMTPDELIQQKLKTEPISVIISGIILLTFILASTLHHACHFCSSTAMKAVILADTHFNYLPIDDKDTNEYHDWRHALQRNIRTFMAVPVKSATIICSLFGALVLTNAYIFISISIPTINSQHDWIKYVSGVFICIILLITYFYGRLFYSHFQGLQNAKNELNIILNSKNQREARLNIRNQSLRKPPITPNLMDQDDPIAQ